MQRINIEKSLLKATKWSVMSEAVAKLAAPITNMVLARVLIPEVFGAIATITVVFSFADMLTDGGFQKYLVQHEFENQSELYQNANIAFWTNIVLSFVIWGIIICFQDQIASIMGSPGLGHVISIACISLPLTSFSSIQMALYRRRFDFKTLFQVRLIDIIVPFIITIPLSLIIKNYWAIIIGTITGNLANAVLLTCKSIWKPSAYYCFSQLKGMVIFSGWTLLEQISIWLTTYIGIFIVGRTLDQYYLGLYKTSMQIVNQIMALVTSSTTTVLFSALSRLQKNKILYEKIFFRFQRIVAIIILPMGVGIYQYRVVCTQILLGSQWMEAADFVGLWGLTSAITIVLSHYSSEVYRSMGMPKLSLFSQLLHLAALIPALIWASGQGFKVLYLTRSYVRLEGILVNLILMATVMHISPFRMIQNITPSALSAIAMGALAKLLKGINNGLLWDFISIFICGVFYFGLIMLFPNIRSEVCVLAKMAVSKAKARSKKMAVNGSNFWED